MAEDQAYFHRRAAEERDAALGAPPPMRALHFALAGLHDELAKSVERLGARGRYLK